MTSTLAADDCTSTTKKPRGCVPSFAFYLEHESLLPVVQELACRGWVGKCWQTRHGRQRGGRPFTKTSLYRLLTNVIYVGKVRYKEEIHDGEQPALIDADTFGRVQALLRSHAPEVGPPSVQRFTALLKGLLRRFRLA
jgi:site-specific DNA recombinase